MQRTKLQAAVRQAVYGQQQIATEGFLGDVIDSVKSVFTGSAGNKVLTEAEIKQGQIDLHKASVRLHETVLNAKWLNNAELKSDTITAKWAIPGLDFDGKLNSDDPVAHLKPAFSEYVRTLKVYSKVIEKHSDEGQRLYAQLIKALVKTEGQKQAVLTELEDIDAEYAKIDPPYKYMAKHPIQLLGNATVTFKDGKTVNDVKPCAVDQLPTLNKEQIAVLGKLVYDFIEEDPEMLIYDHQNYIDWDEIGPDLKHAGASTSVIQKIMDELTASTFLNEFYDQNAWDDTAIGLLLNGTNDFIVRSLLWINASIK